MGIFTGFRLASSAAAVTSPAKAQTGVISPWAGGTLAPLVYSDIFGVNVAPITRSEAMRVPAIVKARAILHSIFSRDLKAFDVNGVVTPQPTWLYRSNTGIAPRTRTKLILDDLFFNEAAMLSLERGSRGVLDAVHIPYDNWRINENGVAEVNSGTGFQEVDASEVKWIMGPGPGILAQARDTLIAARQMDQAWAGRVRNPVPPIVLQEREDNGMTQDEMSEYVKAIATARRNIDNAVMGLPYKITATFQPSEPTDLFETGRNALRLDVANFANIPAALLDGSVSAASLTYSTQEGHRNELYDYTVPYWAGPIEDALSLDDMVPRGQFVRFDFADYLTPTESPTGPASED